MSGGINDNYYLNCSNYNKNNSGFNNTNIDLDDITILFGTEKTEDNRTTFDETFSENIQVNDNIDTDGEKFLEGLKANKTELMSDLGLTDEEYDNLACIALALASQETGMGKEAGYVSENTGVGGLFRRIAKWCDVNIMGGASASSGLTQVKIYDFLNGDKLTQEQKDILKEYGVTAKGVATNNLYDNPDKAAVATMVVLTSLYENYDEYKDVLKNEHSNLEEKLGLTSEEEKNTALTKGEEIINNITNLYDSIADSEEKSEMRNLLKSWLLSVNGSQEGDKGVDNEYNEELCLRKLNEHIANNSSDFTLNSEDLDYIRYALTADDAAMNEREYCAYAWNKGTGETGMQLDRLLADKIGTILKTPEDFDYDQFTVNVSSLAEKYIEQSAD